MKIVEQTVFNVEALKDVCQKLMLKILLIIG